MDDSTRDQKAPMFFIEGFYGGWTGVWDQTYLEMCYVENEELTDLLYEAMGAYMSNDVETGDQKMAATKPLFKTALASCMGYNEALERWSEQFNDIKERPDWDEISKKIYEDNKEDIDKKVKAEFKAWTDGDFGIAGYNASKIQQIFIENAPKEDKLSQFMFIVPF